MSICLGCDVIGVEGGEAGRRWMEGFRSVPIQAVEEIEVFEKSPRSIPFGDGCIFWEG